MATRTSYIQFLVMVEFMEKYGDLSKPQSLPQGRLWCGQKWKELTQLLNSQGSGECRSEEKWRKVWSDLKNNTKRKWAKINKAVKVTGGGPALKTSLTDLENRVMSLVGVQAAVGMPLAEVGFGLMQESSEVGQTTTVADEPHIDHVIIELTETPIVGDEDWNTPGSSKDPGPIPPVESPISPPNPTTLPEPILPPTPPIAIHKQNSTQPSYQRQQRKRKLVNLLEEYVIKSEANAREDNKERERLFVDLERERIRQRDEELRQRDIQLRQRDQEIQLHAQWLEIMKGVLNVIEKYLSEK